MSMSARRLLTAMALAAVATPALAAGGAPEAPASKPSDPDVAAARQAIEAKDWASAKRHLDAALARKPHSAEVHNLLGFTARNQGDLDGAFAHYEKALKIDPKHRPTHEYVGEAYLMAGDLAKAKEHLRKLDKLCFLPCEEYRDLKKAVAEYERKHPAGTR